MRAAFALVFGLALGFNALAVLTPAWLPMGDVGGWIELIDVVARHDDPATRYASTYLLPSGLEPNSLVVHVGSWLCAFLRADEAARLLVLGYALGTPLAVLFLATTFGRSRWLSLLSVPMVFNAMFNVGLLNFLVAFPFLFVAPALARRLAREGASRGAALRDGALLACASVILFYAHVLAFLMALGFTGLVLLLDLRRPRHLARFLSLAPAALLLGRWVLVKYVEAEPTEGGLALAGPDGLALVFQSIDMRLGEFHAWGVRMFRDAADELLLLVILGVWLAMMAASQRQPSPPEPATGPPEPAAGPSAWGLELLTFSCLVAWFALPSHMQEIQLIAERVVMPLLLFLILWPRLDLDRGKVRLLLVPAVLAALVYPWVARTRFERFNDRIVRSLPAMIEGLPPRARLAYVMHEPEVSVTYMGPHWHLAKALMAVENGGVTDDSFAIRPHCPVQFQPGQSPTPLPRDFWNSPALVTWDFVLLWSQARPEETRDHPLLHLRASDGGWQLFEVRRPRMGPRLVAGGAGGLETSVDCAGEAALALHAATDDGGVTGLELQCPRGPRRPLGPPDKVDHRLGCRPGESLVGLHGHADEVLRALGAVCEPEPPAPWCSRAGRDAVSRAGEPSERRERLDDPDALMSLPRFILDDQCRESDAPRPAGSGAPKDRQDPVTGVVRGAPFVLRCPPGERVLGAIGRSGQASERPPFVGPPAPVVPPSRPPQRFFAIGVQCGAVGPLGPRPFGAAGADAARPEGAVGPLGPRSFEAATAP